jgi:hypothetical protein
MLVPNSTFTAFVDYLNETMGSNVTCNTTGGYCYFLERCDAREALFPNITV